tara:strand:+ start:3297 stop:4211 length:915 start_codon:yes stop_codon:yes gene_type:complete
VAVPALSMPNGPPGLQGDQLSTEIGCTCHGAGLPSNEVLVQISGVPESYSLATDYNFIISGDALDSYGAGFIFTDSGKGNFSWSDDVKVDYVPDVEGTIGHSLVNTDKSWSVTWTSPDSDLGDLHFSLVVNVVDGQNGANEGDKWNILSFTISSPDEAVSQEGEGLESRTISVGDYDTLFVQVEDPEAVEREHQRELAESYFNNGNMYYWPTLGILILGAIVQREFYEKRFGGGPPHLAKELAIPQAIKRGSLFLILLFAAVYGYQNWGRTEGILIGCLALWAAYGLYRTWIQAIATPKVKDLV